MSKTNTYGFSLLRNNLFFDVFDKEGLKHSINSLGKNYAVIGVKEHAYGSFPDEFDGIGGYFDGEKLSLDYIIVIQTREPIYFRRTHLKAIGWLYEQTSILLVEEGIPSIVETKDTPTMEDIQNAVAILNAKTIQLLYHVRSGWETDYKDYSVK